MHKGIVSQRKLLRIAAQAARMSAKKRELKLFNSIFLFYASHGLVIRMAAMEQEDPAPSKSFLSLGARCYGKSDLHLFGVSSLLR